MGHIHEKIDFTTSVYIVHEGKVLLHKHKKLGFWLPPGGHIELDEDPLQAALREAKEESGLEVELVGNPKLSRTPTDGSQDLLPPMYLNRHRFNDSHEHIDHVYFGKVLSGEMKAEEEGGEIGWFTHDEIAHLDTTDGVKLYAIAALNYFQNK